MGEGHCEPAKREWMDIFLNFRNSGVAESGLGESTSAKENESESGLAVPSPVPSGSKKARLRISSGGGEENWWM